MHEPRDRNVGAWIDHSDRLYCAVTSSVASVVVRFSGYFRSMNGELREYAVDVAPTSDRVITETNQHFGPGFLLSCVARIISGNANRGQCYARARIQRNTGTPLLVLEKLLGGYVSDDFNPSWPWGRIEGPLEGPGCMRSITGTNPAVNTEVTETVPTGARWRVASMQATLVADANVANRQVSLTIDDGTTVFYTWGNATNQTASQTRTYVFADVGVNLANVQGTFVFPIPNNLWLPAGCRIKTSTLNIQATDDWGAPQMLVEEWLEA